MGIFSRKKKEVREVLPTTSFYPSWLESTSTPMLLSTVYRCVDLISDSIAVLPLETYRIDAEGFKSPMRDADIYEILNLEPNEGMNRFVFFKTMMASVLLKGNAYAYIERGDGNNVQQLIYIPADKVQIGYVEVDRIKRKRYQVKDFDYPLPSVIHPRDMIHVMNFSYDGIVGVSTLTHAANTMAIANNSESHAAGFFKSGGNVGGVLTIEGARLTKEQKAQNYREWEARTNPVTGKPNGVVILEGNQKYQPIAINPKDSQLLESRQFNVIEICRYFSVSPVKVFDLSKSSYSTIEATQLEFLNDTLLPVITKFELEINRKIFLGKERRTTKAEFNTSALLRADKASQATYWNTMFQIGAASPNEIRREINLGKVEGGDKTFVQVNVQTLEQASKLTENQQNNDETA